MAAHKIYPHDMPELLSPGVWLIRGTQDMPLFRNMTVIRLPSGELLMHSAVALSEEGFAALEALGTPRYLIVPNTGHQSDAPFFKRRYPDLVVLTPAGIRRTIEERVAVSGTVEEVLPPLGFTLHAVTGSKLIEYGYEYPLQGGGCMLVLCDTLGSAHSADTSKTMGRLLMRHVVAGDRLGIARTFRWMMVKDLKELKAFVRGLADIPGLRLVTVGHGDPVRADCAAALRAAAA